jgi:hypothetical protein
MAKIFDETSEIISTEVPLIDKQSDTQFNQFHGKLGIYDSLGDDISEEVSIGEIISFAETFGLQVSNELCGLERVER